jgi:hypothetical protein
MEGSRVCASSATCSIRRLAGVQRVASCPHQLGRWNTANPDGPLLPPTRSLVMLHLLEL